MAKRTHDRNGASPPHARAEPDWDERESAIVSGMVLGGKYRLISEIGRGGMGSVWRAEHLGWEAPVALKIMNRDITAHPEAVARFEREVRLAAGLRSPHVVQVLDHGLDEATHTPYIAMELLEGESLARRLKRGGPLSPAEMFRVFSQVVRALSRAHAAGIVHRDLKPDNVFLVRNEEESLTKILDFGVAKWTAPDISESGLTRPGSVVGTPYYMSPEQIQGAPDIDHRVDLWALAAIACECLTGRRPFEAPDFAQLAVLLLGNVKRPVPSSLGPVPPRFDAWFARATAPDITRRFQSAREMVQTLAPICDIAPGSFTPGGVGSDSMPAPREPMFTRPDVASMAPVSNTAARPLLDSRLLEPGSIWQRPVLKLAVSTALATLLVTGGLIWFFRRPASDALPKPPPHTAATPAPAASKSTPTVRPIHSDEGQRPEPYLTPKPVDPSDDLQPPPATVKNDGFDPEATQKKVRAAHLARPKARSKPKKPRPESTAPSPASSPGIPPAAVKQTPEPAPEDANLVGGRRIRTSL